MNRLSHVRIVLVGTTHPGNIGAAARAMKNMGLRDLVLVTPKVFPSEEATARASGADDILAEARICPDLQEAIRDCALVIGASARLRTISWPQLDPRECARQVTAGNAKTAILFGREHSGLTNEELERCHYLLHIPCDPEFSSLNIAAAVQVVAYELFLVAQQQPHDDANRPLLATAGEMESFYGHLEKTLYDLRFLHERKLGPSVMRRLRRIFNRSVLEKKEIHLLRGILTAVQLRIRPQA
ncbi:RNA methyltransferase [Methylocaldum sp.]|uniref:RNA methyltransferase n=1 Tax=Methylocaldum sp. TaxID=1969727 RepID=UPI002D2CAC23|nr:RNA methyltransferase [Methylocaldum sp.]HYE37720.1 RNA methyltransferase [Methylocaldum sp.]